MDVDYVFIGSCTNGRLSDIEVAAKILRNGKVRSRCVAIPASREIYIRAMELGGYIDTLVRAGCVVTYGLRPCLVVTLD